MFLYRHKNIQISPDATIQKPKRQIQCKYFYGKTLTFIFSTYVLYKNKNVQMQSRCYNIDDMDMYMFTYFAHASVHVCTGWGGQSWTIFCGPAAIAVGGCERKDQRNPLGSGLNYYGNIAAGTSGSAVAVEKACCQDTTRSSTRNVKILRFSKASAIAKTWFSM